MKKFVDTGENSADRRPLFAMSPAHVSMPKAFSTCSETCVQLLQYHFSVVLALSYSWQSLCTENMVVMSACHQC